MSSYEPPLKNTATPSVTLTTKSDGGASSYYDFPEGAVTLNDVMEELDVFPKQLAEATKAMLVNFGGENETYALQILQQLRSANIAAEIYPDAAKFDKQMKYANRRGIAYVLLPGDEERQKNMVSVKNFETGEQKMISVDEAIATLKP